MKTLIVFAGKYGATAQAAELLKNAFKCEAEVWDAANGDIDPSAYDAVVLGSSVYAGSIRKPMQQFLNNHASVLKQKPLGLFIVSGSPADAALQYVTKGFGEELAQKAIETGAFGGMFQFDKMNFIERFIIKQMQKGKEDSSASKLNEQAITTFAQHFEEKIQ